MGILATSQNTFFDLDKIHKSDFIRLKHKSWDDYENGLVVKATREEIIALYLLPGTNVHSRITVLVDDVCNEEWEIKWSSDLENIETENIEVENNEDP